MARGKSRKQMNVQNNQGPRARSSRALTLVGPPPEVTSYGGPLTLGAPSVTADDTVVVEVHVAGSVSTSAGGVVSTVFDSYAQASASVNWTELTALYTEFRILSMHVDLRPWKKFNQPTTTDLAPVLSLTSRNGATAIASMSEASGYDSVQIHDPSTQIQRHIEMKGPAEAQFIVVSSSPNSTARQYVKLFSSGNTATTVVYDYLSTILVQFRGRA